jgi:osmoprotectant transport system ATP-binding protein
MNVGGIVEQVAAPAELLARPSNSFVERFVGSQRGLRRLSLISLADIELDRVGSDDARPHVERATSLLDALQSILRAGTESADVLDNGKYAGTITLQRIARETR